MKYKVLYPDTTIVDVSKEEFESANERQKTMFGGSDIMLIDPSAGGGLMLLPYTNIRRAIVEQPVLVNVGDISASLHCLGLREKFYKKEDLNF